MSVSVAGDVAASRAAMPEDHFILQMGIDVTREGDAVIGSATVHPRLCADGTLRLRMAVLATWVDVVAGHVPDGDAHTPTVDLRVQQVGALPKEGEVSMVGRAERVGRRLIVSDTTLRDAAGRLFARATATFVNHSIGVNAIDVTSRRPPSVASVEALIGARPVGADTVEVMPRPALANGHVGTVQGGVQAFVAEIAAERIAGPGATATDLDIRYLSMVKVGPLRARAERLGRVGGLEIVRVALSDAGNDDATVSVVTLAMATP